MGSGLFVVLLLLNVTYLAQQCHLCMCSGLPIWPMLDISVFISVCELCTQVAIMRMNHGIVDMHCSQSRAPKSYTILPPHIDCFTVERNLLTTIFPYECICTLYTSHCAVAVDLWMYNWGDVQSFILYVYNFYYK